MAKMLTFKMRGEKYHCAYYCAACKGMHFFSPEVHKYNGNDNFPTVTPSLLHTWTDRGREHELFLASKGLHRCHSFITDGKIAYCNDCTHDKAGQTFLLEDFDEALIEKFRL